MPEAKRAPGSSRRYELVGPLTQLAGVGPKGAARLARLGIVRVQDLLFHLPLRYEDRTRVTPIGSLRAATSAVVEGTVELTQVRPGRRRALLCRIGDGTGALTLRFFHFGPSQQRHLNRGDRLRCFGEVRPGPTTLEMVHPEMQPLTGQRPPSLNQTLTPIYPSTEGLHQLTLRRLFAQLLPDLDRVADLEILPQTVLERWHLSLLPEALAAIHAPAADADVDRLLAGSHPAVQRVAFEELMAHRLSLLRRKRDLATQQAPALQARGALSQGLQRQLPFGLTGAQQRVVAQIEADLAGPRPMLRLLQGDVGSGKTVVAALASCTALECGHKVALMAPTELLAEQHLRSFRAWFAPLDVPVVWLTGSLNRKARERALAQLDEDAPVIAIGTHALFQRQVAFRGLGLVIVDEQHRFGVHQRLALRQKGAAPGRQPHQLIMTATPIPRTLTMTAYADLDTSVIDELPPGRRPVRTSVLPDSRREEVMERIAHACAQGRQVYWVCSLIEESELLQCEAASDTADTLAAKLPALRIGLVHGRLSSTQKDAVMSAFSSGELDILVATTVIEVGVDVPNASLMIIENAERFGLAQLHQLRGRVGRGSVQSDCVLMYRDLSEMARQRLAIMRDTDDGFRIAEKDLELRGPGEVLGTRQAGTIAFRVADLARDRQLLGSVTEASDQLQSQFPDRVEPLIRRWLPLAEDYAGV